MKFSDLPENSWEKIMVNLVEYIGGDSPALVKWKNETPDPVEVATAILDMVQFYDPDCWDLTEGSLAETFKETYNLENKDEKL